MVFGKNEFNWLAYTQRCIIVLILILFFSACRTIDINKTHLIKGIMDNPERIIETIEESKYFKPKNKHTYLQDRLLKKWSKYITDHFQDGYSYIMNDFFELKTPKGKIFRYINLLGIKSNSNDYKLYFTFCRDNESQDWKLCVISDFDTRELDE